MIVNNLNGTLKITYDVTSSDQKTVSGVLQPLSFTAVTPQGRPPWSVLLNGSVELRGIDSPDVVASYVPNLKDPSGIVTESEG